MSTLEIVRQIGDWHTQTIAHGLDQPLLVQKTIEAACDLGLKQLCLTDHYPLPLGFEDPTPEKDCSMPWETYFGTYLNDVATLQNSFSKKIDIRFGAEFDWLPDYETWTREQTLKRPYDYLIGSVHFLRDQTGKYWLLDYSEEMFIQATKAFGGIENLIKSYYREMRSMVNSSLFDGVGHLDLIKKYNPQVNQLFDENEFWYQKEVKQTLDEIAKSGMTMEINTAGLQKKCQATYPSSWILKEAKKRNIEITIGSDAHKPEEIGRDLVRAVELAELAGYTSVQTFKNRNKSPVSLISYEK